jgi:hypothetical protein
LFYGLQDTDSLGFLDTMHTKAAQRTRSFF